MLNIYICEDNDNERDYLSQLIKNIILIEDYDLNFACATADQIGRASCRERV